MRVRKTPGILLADEPTGNLDSRSSEEIINILKGLHQEGITVVVVTHEPDIAAHTERIVSMLDGKVVSDERNEHFQPHRAQAVWGGFAS